MANPILVLAEQLRGEISDITFEMLGAGRNLASAWGTPLYAVLLGSQAAPLAAKLGLADKVFVADNPQLNLAPAGTIAAALKAVMDQTQAGLVLVGCTNVSLGIGSILSAKAGLPLVNFCRAAKADGGAVVFTSQLFGGKILSDVKLAGRPGHRQHLSGRVSAGRRQERQDADPSRRWTCRSRRPRILVASNMTDINPFPSTGGGPSHGLATIPSHRASMGMETMFSSFTYLPSTSSPKPSSRFRTHHCMGTSHSNCLLERSGN